MHKIEIGERVRIYRKGQRLSQGRLAELAGCSIDYISALERGKYYPNVKKLDRIAQVLQVPVSRILGDLGPEQLPGPGYQGAWMLANFQEQFEKIDPQLQMLLIELLETLSGGPASGLGGPGFMGGYEKGPHSDWPGGL